MKHAALNIHSRCAVLPMVLACASGLKKVGQDKSGYRDETSNSGSRTANFNNSPLNSNWNISLRAKRKIKRYTKHGETDRLRMFLASWKGHAQWADSKNLLVKLGVAA